MNKIKMLLSDLKDDIYNAEDSIDGAYNSKSPDYAQFEEINKKYDKLILDMRLLYDLLDNTVEKL